MPTSPTCPNKKQAECKRFGSETGFQIDYLAGVLLSFTGIVNFKSVLREVKEAPTFIPIVNTIPQYRAASVWLTQCDQQDNAVTEHN